jgi:hypothetical protein
VRLDLDNSYSLRVGRSSRIRMVIPSLRATMRDSRRTRRMTSKGLFRPSEVQLSNLFVGKNHPGPEFVVGALRSVIVCD